MDRIATARVVATNLYGGKANPYYAEDHMRIAEVRIDRNVEGKFLVTLIPARYVPATGTYVSDHVAVATVMRESESSAREVANVMWTFGRDRLDGQVCGEDHAGLLALGIDSFESHSHCPTCDRFDTLSIALESYGDRTTCSACTYHDWYSIGD